MHTTQESIEELSLRQQEMEDHALALGGQRFRKKLEDAIANGTEAQVGAAKRLLTNGLDKMEAALTEMFLGKGKVGRPHMASRWVKLLGAQAASYLTLKVVLDNIHARVAVRTAAQDLCELILDELRFRRFKEKEPRLFEYAMTDFKTQSYVHRARSLDARLHKAEVDVSDLTMNPADRLIVGVKLLDVLITVTGLVEVQKQAVRENGKVVQKVDLVATQETLEWLSVRNGALEFLWPVNLPMLMPPLPWAPGRKGGYRFGLRGKHSLVRSKFGQAPHEKLLEPDCALPMVYGALNRIQETPWRINKRVLEVIESLQELGGDRAGIPAMSDAPMPPKPEDIGVNKDVTREWRRSASKVHDLNHENSIKRADLARLLSVVKRVKDEGAIWFPHNLDFRGRIYPVVNYLHPQGDDMCKGLLQFAEGKPVGKDGVAYLALHGASSLGKTLQGAKLSHMTLQERVDYILSITQDIMEVAEDPLANQWWIDADDCWQFLAFCFDWAEWAKADQEGLGDCYVSCLPVAMDGTCNGLQHFAALWLDPSGGAAVNVVPSDRPKDIYQTIADEVLNQLEVDTENVFSTLWLSSGIVDRKLTKRPTMTFGYGSQRYGFTTQLREYVQGHEEWRGRLKDHFSEWVTNDIGEPIQRNRLPQACMYMAELIWRSLERVAVSAFQGMAWMSECASLVTKESGKCLEWVVPCTGFPVRQSYFKETKNRNVTTILAGKTLKPVLFEKTSKADHRKQASAVAPNLVHSLDAACLAVTVNQAAAEGVEHFAMVHDSYGTLAADAPLLATATRQAFHQLYSSNDVVSALWTQFHSQLPEGSETELPVPPAKGSNGQLMDLSGVMLSDYFFS